MHYLSWVLQWAAEAQSRCALSEVMCQRHIAESVYQTTGKEGFIRGLNLHFLKFDLGVLTPLLIQAEWLSMVLKDLR